MATIRDLDTIERVMPEWADQISEGTSVDEPSTCRPINTIAKLVYADCAVLNVYAPTDIVLAHPIAAFVLLLSADVQIVDPGVRAAYDNWMVEAAQGGRSVFPARMTERRFAVMFADAPSVPRNLRGEMLDLQVMPSRYVSENDVHFGDVRVVRRDGTPTQEFNSWF